LHHNLQDHQPTLNQEIRETDLLVEKQLDVIDTFRAVAMNRWRIWGRESDIRREENNATMEQSELPSFFCQITLPLSILRSLMVPSMEETNVEFGEAAIFFVSTLDTAVL